MGSQTSLKSSQREGLQPPQPSPWIRLCIISVLFNKMFKLSRTAPAPEETFIHSFIHSFVYWFIQIYNFLIFSLPTNSKG